MQILSRFVCVCMCVCACNDANVIQTITHTNTHQVGQLQGAL